MNRNKLALVGILGASLLLSACGEDRTSTVQSIRYVQISVPESLFRCPQIRTIPEIETLTDVQVAKLIASLYKSNQTCDESMRAIKNYVAEANKRIKSQ